MKEKFIIIVLIAMIFTLTSCSNANNKDNTHSAEPVKGTHSGMGTLIEFTVYGDNAKEAIKKGKEVMNEIEQEMSLNIKDSEVNKINAQAGKTAVSVSPETFSVVKRGVYFSKLTEGNFDITIAPISQLWDIGQDDARVPSQDEIEALLPLVNYRHIQLDEKNTSVLLEEKDMKIDLGGIAKGYAADRVIDVFKDMGIKNALVSVGGNIKVIGENPQKGRAWTVGLRHPRKARGNYFATIRLNDGETVVTSGDYERYFIKDDIRYHHIFNAKEGQPSKSDIIGATIITQNSMDADGLSTSLFVLGSNKGMKMIDELEGVEAVIITRDLKVMMTEGIKDRIDVESMQLEAE
ncbi:FAD:protein FMN transferase [Irregularibacter muris]|uniref:FAD:protein FMN transferase n=1 Tax=Irregularibacter muris TaxID=1796619 RepID=A0AAE3KZX7_9FIRM|nr:FAD:protein FMN transferase [Irregularibacter muris]MCR1899895.1 FAD:protein FMN transferase [Irregularibacter muris]